MQHDDHHDPYYCIYHNNKVQLNGIYGLNWFTVVKSKKHSMTSNGSQYEVTVVKYPNVT